MRFSFGTTQPIVLVEPRWPKERGRGERVEGGAAGSTSISMCERSSVGKWWPQAAHSRGISVIPPKARMGRASAP